MFHALSDLGAVSSPFSMESFLSQTNPIFSQILVMAPIASHLYVSIPYRHGFWGVFANIANFRPDFPEGPTTTARLALGDKPHVF